MAQQSILLRLMDVVKINLVIPYLIQGALTRHAAFPRVFFMKLTLMLGLWRHRIGTGKMGKI